MAAEIKISGSAASLGETPTTEAVKPDTAKVSPSLQFDDESKRTTSNQYEAAFLSKYMDLPWDVGPGFVYWPLPNLDALAKAEFLWPNQDIHAPISRTHHAPGFWGFQASNHFDESIATHLQTANAWESPTSWRSDQNEAVGLFRDQEGLGDETGGSTYVFDSEPLLCGDDHDRGLYYPCPVSPASTVTLAPSPDSYSRPVSPPAALPAFPPKGWNCTQCDNPFGKNAP